MSIAPFAAHRTEGARVACYFIARIEIHDADGYRRYLDGTGPLLDRFGATVLAVDEATVRLEGEWPATRTVLIAFPDEAAAHAWYASAEYQAIARHRFAASTGDAVLVRGTEAARGEVDRPIETERLVLAPLSLDDVPRVFEYRSDPDVSRYQSFDPRSREDAERFIAAPSAWRQFAIRPKAGGALAGDLGFRLSDDDPAQAEVGVTVAPDSQRRGIAAEAVRGLLGRLFGELGVHRVYASVDPRNEASMALFARLGFRQEAHMRESLMFKGEWADDVVFAMLRREWETAASGDARSGERIDG